MSLSRFRLRTLMIAVAVVAILIVAWSNRGRPRAIAYGVGHKMVRLDFAVVDVDSGRAIEGASVRLRDPDSRAESGAPWNIDGITDAGGHAKINVDLRVYSWWDADNPSDYHQRVVYHPWDVKVDARGYRRSEVRFWDHSKRDARFNRDAVPPVVTIRLRSRPQDLRHQSTASGETPGL